MDIILKYFSDFTPEQLNQLKSLAGLYKEWNEKINVISRKDIDSLYEKHVLHSLSIAAVFEFEPGTEILDLGTGGGFPGIPLAVFFPETKFHLVDSIAKKLKVAGAVADGIGLKNITTQHIRAEEIKKRKFDFVVSRAVAPLKDLWKWSKPLLKSQQTANRSGRPEVHHAKLSSLTTSDPGLRTQKPGLICLKGGNLTLEIRESGTQPLVVEISGLFSEDFFKEKYLLFVST
jgi:16S rRNA (guanine527-N7)-methyltransferase